MSALGQKRTLRRVCVMSALPPKADIESRSRDVRFVPKADICSAAIRTATRSPRRREKAVIVALKGERLSLRALCPLAQTPLGK
jgi:hypothetical protein